MSGKNAVLGAIALITVAAILSGLVKLAIDRLTS
jgi:hypothetical protein